MTITATTTDTVNANATATATEICGSCGRRAVMVWECCGIPVHKEAGEGCTSPDHGGWYCCEECFAALHAWAWEEYFSE